MPSSHGPRQRRFLLCVVLLVATLSMPASRGQANAEPGSPSPESVSICIGGAPGIPVLLAHTLGIFTKEGLNVTLKEYPNAPSAFEGMLAGECDMTTVGETPIVMKSFERQDFSILATLASSDDATRIIANKGKGIRSPKDMKGKRLFVHKGSTNHFFLEMFLLKNGLSAQDVTLLFKADGDISEALIHGRIDAFAGTEVIINKSRKVLGDKGIVFSAPGICLITINLLGMDSAIREKPEVVRSVLNAILQAEEKMSKERQQATQKLSRVMEINERDMAIILGSYIWKVGLAQTLLLSLEQEAQWAMDSGFTNKTRIPNYLNFIHRDALRSLKPEAVTIMQ